MKHKPIITHTHNESLNMNVAYSIYREEVVSDNTNDKTVKLEHFITICDEVHVQLFLQKDERAFWKSRDNSS